MPEQPRTAEPKTPPHPLRTHPFYEPPKQACTTQATPSTHRALYACGGTLGLKPFAHQRGCTSKKQSRLGARKHRHPRIDSGHPEGNHRIDEHDHGASFASCGEARGMPRSHAPRRRAHHHYKPRLLHVGNCTGGADRLELAAPRIGSSIGGVGIHALRSQSVGKSVQVAPVGIALVDKHGDRTSLPLRRRKRLADASQRVVPRRFLKRAVIPPAQRSAPAPSLAFGAASARLRNQHLCRRISIRAQRPDALGMRGASRNRPMPASPFSAVLRQARKAHKAEHPVQQLAAPAAAAAASIALSEPEAFGSASALPEQPAKAIPAPIAVAPAIKPRRLRAPFPFLSSMRITYRPCAYTVETSPLSMHSCAISIQSMNWMAPFGHCSAQRPHDTHFVETPVSGLIFGSPTGMPRGTCRTRCRRPPR